MKVVIIQKAIAVLGRAEAPSRVRLSYEPAPGFLCQVLMGPAGVMLKAFNAHVMIPMAQLWSLAEALDSRFRVPAGETQDRAAEAPQCSRQSVAGIPALIITNLEGGWIAAEGLRFYTIASIAEEAAKGFIREVDFGTDGVMLTITGVQVYVPLRQLFAIAEAVDPAFQPPPVGPLTKIS